MSVFDNILERFKSITAVKGLHIEFTDANDYECYLVELKKRKQKIHITHKDRATTLDALKLSKNDVLSLSVGGKGILTKQIDNGDINTSELNDSAVLQLVLPNADANQFYTQIHNIAGLTLVSIIRRENLSTILKQLSAMHAKVIGLTLANQAVANVVPLIAPSQSEINSFGTQFKFTDQGVSDITLNSNGGTNVLTIGEETLQQGEVSAYVSAFQVIAPVNAVLVTDESIEKNFSGYLESQLFKKLGIGILAFIFIILLANQFLYMRLKDSYNQLASQAVYSKQLISQRDSLKVQLDEKENFLHTAGWLSPSKNSYYADRVASIMPRSIVLDELQVNPLDIKATRKSKKQVFTKNKLLITGRCATGAVLTPWIDRLNEYDWAQKVHVIDYHFDEEKHIGIFTISIDIIDV